MSKRNEFLIAAILDEVALKEDEKKTPNIKEGDYVEITKGAMTGYTGEVTFLSPCGTLADVKFENGRVGRVSTYHLQKTKKKQKKDVKAGL